MVCAVCLYILKGFYDKPSHNYVIFLMTLFYILTVAVKELEELGKHPLSYHGFAMREVSVNSTSLYETN